MEDKQHCRDKQSVNLKVFNTVGEYYPFCGVNLPVLWRIFNKVGDTISTLEGYHRYSGGISSVHWRVFSKASNLLITKNKLRTS